MKSNQKIKLAELIGIILGDGHLHKKQNKITIVGSLEDFYYYRYYVVPLIKSLFDVNPKLRKRNDRNAYYIDFSSKKVMNFLSEECGMIRGNKVNAKIPRFIINDKKLIPYFLRGLFDTDGCLKFSKQGKDINYYPRIQIAIKESFFSEEIGLIMDQIGFQYGKWLELRKDNWSNSTFYHISGKENLERWMHEIGSNNPVHKSKYLFWKKLGYYIPLSSLNDRLNTLNLKIEGFF
jgi:DNA-binding transcriptional regulator WhiA